MVSDSQYSRGDDFTLPRTTSISVLSAHTKSPGTQSVYLPTPFETSPSSHLNNPPSPITPKVQSLAPLCLNIQYPDSRVSQYTLLLLCYVHLLRHEYI
jgi:hypothetical protein